MLRVTLLQLLNVFLTNLKSLTVIVFEYVIKSFVVLYRDCLTVCMLCLTHLILYFFTYLDI
jgi:hypothetical protein